MTQKQTLSHEEIVADILGCVPDDIAVDADFPSRGLFYTPQDPSRPIQIRPMTFEDERGIASIKDARGNKAIDYIISRCLLNVSPGQILEMDKIYILIKIREISYGSDFKADITCPECGDTQPISIDISKLAHLKVPEDLTNPREVYLPVCEKHARVIFPKAEDHKYLNNVEVAAANMYRFIESIDGHTNKEIISAVVKKLKLKDIHTLLNGIGMPEYGVDTQFLYKCESLGCGCETKLEVPFDESFFTGR